MPYSISQSRLFFRDETPRPLGRLTLAGEIHGSTGIAPTKLRVLGRYALVCLAAGEGFYRDVRGVKKRVGAGQAILVFPEIAHSYGPTARKHWNEIYVCFEGRVFDLWRDEGLLPSLQPVFDLPSPQCFFTLRDLLSEPRPLQMQDHLKQLHQFLAILGDVLPIPDLANTSSNNWIMRAQAVLGADLEKTNGLHRAAQVAGQSYETFRKRFAREAGMSPARFRDERRLEAAKTLLLRGEMTNASIARSLGFRDEAHFSRRFKELAQQTPRDFRRAARGGQEIRPEGIEPPTEAL